MQGMNSATVDLIYLDPPFNSNKSFSAPIGSKAAGSSFEDAWRIKGDLDNLRVVEWELLSQKYEVLGDKLKAVCQAGRQAHGKAMFAYLIFMTPRLFECHRLLKETGSLYLHCDPYANSYLRLVLDCIFGRSNFRNEIIWGYAPTGNPPKNGYPRKHDVILFYGKTNKNYWCQPYTEMTNATRSSYSAIDKSGRRYSKAHGQRTYLDESKGRPVPSWWVDIGSGSHLPHKERQGYPTQKPLKLLERIIKASSKPKDLVLDPFCGCATTMVAADRLNRRWAGIDLSAKATELVKIRIQDDRGPALDYLEQIKEFKSPPVRSDRGPALTSTQKKAYKKELYGQCEGYCPGCKIHTRSELMDLDRIIPGKLGGTYHKPNLQLLCRNCNLRKSDKTQARFMQELARTKA